MNGEAGVKGPAPGVCNHYKGHRAATSGSPKLRRQRQHLHRGGSHRPTDGPTGTGRAPQRAVPKACTPALQIHTLLG